MQLRRLAALALAGLALPTSAAALSIQFDVLGGASGTDLTAEGALYSSADYDTWTLADAPMDVETVQINSWTAQLATGWMSHNISITNESSTAQTIVASVSLPWDSAFAFSSIAGSSFGVAFTDSDADGSFSFGADGAAPLFQGLIQGVSALDLGLPGGSLGIADCSPFVFDGCSGSAANGVASAVASGLADSLGITLTFQLSAGDSVSLTSRFGLDESAATATTTPEPGTASLIAFGLVGMALRGRPLLRS